MLLNASCLYTTRYPDPEVMIKPLKLRVLPVVVLELISTVEMGLIDYIKHR
jgi:hypothetical protein